VALALFFAQGKMETPYANASPANQMNMMPKPSFDAGVGLGWVFFGNADGMPQREIRQQCGDGIIWREALPLIGEE
jgi:hypothetical protein